MGSTKSLSWIAAALLLTAMPAAAHHSFAAEFDATKPISVRGTVTKMMWTNPHGWLFVNVKADSGKIVNWAVETGGPNGLYRRGWKKDSVPVGATVVVDGFLAKDGTPTMNGVKITFPDGHQLSVGSSAPGTEDDFEDAIRAR